MTLADPAQTARVFSLAGKLEQQVNLDPLAGSIETGQEAGTLTYTQGGDEVASAKIVAAQSQAAPSPLEWMMVQVDRLARLVRGEPLTAETKVVNTAPDPLEYDGFQAAA